MKSRDLTRFSAAYFLETPFRLFVSHQDADHLPRLKFNFLHDLGHWQIRRDQVRDEIDFLDALRKEVEVFVTPHHGYSGVDVLNFPASSPAVSLSGTFGVGKTTTFHGVVTTVTETPEIEFITLSLSPPSLNEILFADLQGRYAELKQKISRLISLSRCLYSIIFASMRRLHAANVFRTTLLRECPWHLFHGEGLPTAR